MEWLYKNAGLGQHSLLLQEQEQPGGVRKGCKATKQAK